MTFWDFCAPFYDIAEKANGRAYDEMLKMVRELVPSGASVLEIAAGTGTISLTAADKANAVLCTDVSERMLAVAKKKAAKRGVSNVRFGNVNIFGTGLPNDGFDVVIASQVLHLIDEPQKAAAELRRVAKTLVILPMSFTKNLRGAAKLSIALYKVFGFSPKRDFSKEDYAAFLPEIGFDGCEVRQIDGKIPMAVAVWKKV
ncbi:MAG: class I SAM-dependent methyltransferase [Oscillospiraceae bacterium]|jgi:ubiquinone/menaquinone biosynthesis C-methylase UbiE|nr:class I SAM-dependent methyltransferase [Oscillospiraceae bacterium]